MRSSRTSARASTKPPAKRRRLSVRAAKASAPEASARALEWLRDWTRRQCGIAFSEDQRELLSARLEGLCRDLELSLEEVQTRIELGDRALTLRLADAVSTNFTFFFREPEMFEYLAQHILPRLPRSQPLRIWSAAASSGEEAYSIAIQARESLDEATTRVRILGTDISARQLELAEHGVYRRDQLTALGDARRARWFTPLANGQFKVHEQLRQMCTFRRLNLLRRPWPFAQKFHVIFLRNVLYYFEPHTRHELLEACYDAVEPRGFLVTSLTEPMAQDDTRWTAIRTAVFQRGAR